MYQPEPDIQSHIQVQNGHTDKAGFGEGTSSDEMSFSGGRWKRLQSLSNRKKRRSSVVAQIMQLS